MVTQPLLSTYHMPDFLPDPLLGPRNTCQAFFKALRASLMAQRLKRLPPMRETRVQSLGREDPLEKEMAIHSSILAWRLP